MSSNSAVRIIKRGTQCLNGLTAEHDEKAGRESGRQIVSTVKSWIAESQQRRLAEARRASSLKHRPIGTATRPFMNLRRALMAIDAHPSQG
jgi:hypothetical protein